MPSSLFKKDYGTGVFFWELCENFTWNLLHDTGEAKITYKCDKNTL